MSYERTPEIRSKQSQKMKKKVLEYDWDQIDEKRKETLLRNNTKVGRKKGSGRARYGVEKKCIVRSEKGRVGKEYGSVGSAEE